MCIELHMNYNKYGLQIICPADFIPDISIIHIE